ncbi:ABC transporter ATP-binding protein [Stackebrandtia sp.]|uniref:ABC transporter ATP-binding protein n=1 Tax=Stackebrandtia sp. TaxID=2023065 RepID=UPI0032C22EF4
MLTVSELSAGYHGGTVLSGVSLEVAEGRVHAVVGHNGAGKSTLLSTIAGLLPASAGRVDLDGRDVTRAATHRRARLGIGYVPQGRRVFASITVEEHLAIAHRKGARWTPRSVVEMLPRLGQRAKHRGAQLSGGEQQMLAIARALVTGPRLLLLDEPTEGLAPTIVTQIRHTIAELARSGMTILLTAPQLEWPLAIADHISVLSAGRVTTDSTGDAARAEPERLRESLSL